MLEIPNLDGTEKLAMAHKKLIILPWAENMKNYLGKTISQCLFT